MLLKVVFDKTVFVITLIKTLTKHVKNNQKFIGKFIPPYGLSKFQENIPRTKSLKIFVISKKKTIA